MVAPRASDGPRSVLKEQMQHQHGTIDRRHMITHGPRVTERRAASNPLTATYRTRGLHHP